MGNPILTDWFKALAGVDADPAEGGALRIGGQDFVVRDGLPRACALASAAQDQTRSVFGFKWGLRSTYERPGHLEVLRAWLVERYGPLDEAPWLRGVDAPPVLLDAGCGAAVTAMTLLGPVLDRVRYLGVDISTAVDVARTRFAEAGLSGQFLQADLNRVPLPPESVDAILSEGVLHHTDSTEAAFRSLVPLLKPGGRFLFYVYRRKGPIREFTDDHVRDRLQSMTPDEAWAALMPLTRLGKVLGDLDIEIEVPEPIDVLEIPAGRINLQRLIYWHVMKAYYRPDMTLDEMNHINFDWYSPRNAHRHTPEEVRGWCADCGLVIERENVQEAGISIIARKA